MLSYADKYHQQQAQRLELPVLLSSPGKAKPIPWRQC